MWQSKRVVKKQRKRRGPVFFIFSLVFLFAIALLIIVLSSQIFLYQKDSFLNPIAKQREIARNNLGQILKSKNIDFLTISTDFDTYVVNLKDGEQIIFSAKKNLETQVSSLQLVLSRLKIEGKKFKILDFRYDNPVVSFNL